MALTRFCDSSGIHACRRHPGALRLKAVKLLVIPDIAVLRTFVVTGVGRVIPIFTSLHQALAQTSVGGPGAQQACGFQNSATCLHFASISCIMML
jgi:hypothetical protein